MTGIRQQLAEAIDAAIDPEDGRGDPIYVPTDQIIESVLDVLGVSADEWDQAITFMIGEVDPDSGGYQSFGLTMVSRESIPKPGTYRLVRVKGKDA